ERAWLRFSESSRATCVASAIRRADSRLVSAAIAHSKDLKSSAVRITRPSRRLVSICCWTSWISARISARRSRGCCGVFSGCRRWLGLRLGMVVPLATGVSENDDYQRACGRRETPLQGTDSFGSLPDPPTLPQSFGDASMNRCRWPSERAATEHLVKFAAVG